MTFPWTMKITSSEMLVERSAILSRLRAIVINLIARSMVLGSASMCVISSLNT